MPKFVKTKRTDRFSNSKFKRAEFNSFSFGKSLKSYNNKNLLFTNYVNSDKNENYLRLIKLKKEIDLKNYSFLEKNFLPLDEVTYTYKTADRLLDIINKGYGHLYTKKDLKKIYKMKNKENAKFQLFVDVSNNNFTIILIDLFHLAIPANKNGANGTTRLEIDRLYNKQANNKWNLSNIITNSSS